MSATRLDIPPLPPVGPPPELRTMAQRLAHPLTLRGLQDLADREGVCRNPIPLRMTSEATGETNIAFKPCGATQARKCPACAKAGRRLRVEQAKAGWHLADEPLPEPELNDDQAALLRTRGVYEFLRQDSADKGHWLDVVDLDDAIDECERQMRRSGLRGRIPPRCGADPQQAAAWRDQDTGQADAAAQAERHGGGEGADPAGVVAAGDGGGDLVSASVNGAQIPAEPNADNTTSSGGRAGRRSRSTRRRDDAPDLPRRPVAPRTVGRTFTSAEGRVYRPSTFLTVTLPSYGRVKEDGTPVDPTTYDYAAMARDAVHFPALIDRFYQNLRRAEGWNVQYFGAVEPQRRLAPHAHFAIRGAIARQVIRDVHAGTYKHVWWPATNEVVYEIDGPRPVWDHTQGGYRDPDTGQLLPTWDEALDALDEQADAYHVVRFGTQLNIQGVPATSPKADQLLGYLTKYLTKSVSECHHISADAKAHHFDRFRHELAITPCSPQCANWLRYGIQPKSPKDGLQAGYCRRKVHQPATLGLGGRRVLVSRFWSGKTLSDHKYDTHAWLRELLAATRRYTDPIDDEHAHTIQQARQHLAPDPLAFDRVKPGDPGVPDRARLLLRYIESRKRERAAIAAATAEHAARQSRDRPG